MSSDGHRDRKALIQRIESLERSGVTHVRRGRGQLPAGLPPVVPSDAAVPAATAQPAVVKPAPPAAAAQPVAMAKAPPADKSAALEIIRHEVSQCVRCSHLAKTRKQTVFGVGNPQARLCFVGEAPGADEDAQGIPFVGRAGQLLTKIIEACKLTRDEVYILNVLKCRPPENRTPEPDEVSNCRGFLDRQLEVIRPEYICCLGAVAAKTVLDSTRSIGQLRGKFHDYRGIPVLCTYHPSYLLRNPNAKRDVWEDMKVLMARMGIDVGA